jgi:outer membrane lipoprotein carrier protein
MKFIPLFFATTLIAFSATAASADGLKSLENFMKLAKRGQSDFTQTVTSPAKEGQAPRVRTSSGTFAFERPGRFRFIYTQPFAQTIVADGKTLWLFDQDLNQVTQRPQAQALGSTPAALVASSADLTAVRKEFNLESAPEEDGLEWVLATPKTPDGQLKSVRIGFEGDNLAVLDIVDGFGQRSLVRFTGMQSNIKLPTGTFIFKPPVDADVLAPSAP